MLLLLGFAMPPILQLRNVPHNRVIRREQGHPQASVWLLTVLVLRCLSGCCYGKRRCESRRYSGDWFLVGMGLFALIVWLGVKLLKRLRNVSSHASWRLRSQPLQRRPGATIAQVVALSLGLMACCY